VSPGQLCNKLLHNCFLRPSLSQSPHVLQASRAEPLDARKLILAIMGQPVDHPRSPTLGSLPGEDIAANRPIEEHQLAIDRERSTNLGGTDASLEVLKEFVVAGGQLEAFFHAFSLAQIFTTTIDIVVGNIKFKCIIMNNL